MSGDYLLGFHHRDRFEWKSPLYEYEFDRNPIDLIIGDKDIRKRLENFESIDEIEKSWQGDLNAFIELSKKYQLYA